MASRGMDTREGFRRWWENQRGRLFPAGSEDEKILKNWCSTADVQGRKDERACRGRKPAPGGRDHE